MPEEIPFLYSDEQAFPDVSQALSDPNGLLAFGAHLSEQRLLEAYSKGIFPWFNSDDPHILWWSPDPRAVLYPDNFHISRSLGKLIKQNKYQLRFDTNFAQVMFLCGETRLEKGGTWITESMRNAYQLLHTKGYAHSIEVYNADKNLVGGLYGVSLGKMFFGESMFSLEANTSKLAMHALMRWLVVNKFYCLDCQIMNNHLQSLGATEISRQAFTALLQQSNAFTSITGTWFNEQSGEK